MKREKRCIASWQMTYNCNFNCEYCFGHKIGPIKEGLPLLKIIKTLNAVGVKWRIDMTGGEPFLFPNFIEICEVLNKNGIKIAVDTNLSNNLKVREFAERIEPNNVEFLHISVHIKEREKRNGIGDFIQNLLLLKRKGFVSIVDYVLYPTLMDRFENDFRYFLSYGIYLKPKPFRGRYNGKSYPDSYSEEDKKMILEINPDSIYSFPFHSRGVICGAGRIMIRIKTDGVVTRCVADQSVLGDIFSGIKLYEEFKPCEIDICPCWGGRLTKIIKKEKR